MKKLMKKNDWILLGIVIGTALLICVMRYFVGDEHPGYVTVRIDGEVAATYDLSVNQVVELNGGTNIMKIEKGSVDMTEADCPDKLCVNQKPVSRNNESIICLPNKIVLQIINQDESEIDAMTN